MQDAGREEPFTYLGTAPAPDNVGYALEVQRVPDGRAERSRCSTSTASGSSGGDEVASGSLLQ